MAAHVCAAIFLNWKSQRIANSHCRRQYSGCRRVSTHSYVLISYQKILPSIFGHTLSGVKTSSLFPPECCDPSVRPNIRGRNVIPAGTSDYCEFEREHIIPASDFGDRAVDKGRMAA